MSFKNSVMPIEAIGIDAATLGGAVYLPINDPGLSRVCNLVRINNKSSVDIYISWDGVTLHDYIPLGESLSYQFFNTRDVGMYTPGIKKGQIFYALADAAGIGFIYVSGYYQEVA